MDSAIIIGCISGDERAWIDLFERAYPLARRVVNRMVRDNHLAEDVVQNALLKMMCSLHTLRNHDCFNSWLTRIVKNEAYLTLRLNRNEHPGEIFETDVPVNSGGHTDLSESVAFRTMMIRAIRKLPLEQRDVVVFREIQGYKIDEIGAMLDVPPGTVKSRIYRAREKLRKTLDVFAVTRKEKIAMHEKPTEELLYDYLEGHLSAVEVSALESMLDKDPSLKEKLAKQRSFLRILHSITGKLSLSAAEIAEKMKKIEEALKDYKLTEKYTLYVDGKPLVSTGKVYYKSPDKYRLEQNHPVMGDIIIVSRGQHVLSFNMAEKVARQMKIGESAMDKFILRYPLLIRTLSENNTVTLIGKETIESKRCYHLTFAAKVPEIVDGEMLTHLWIEEETWFPLLEEYYDTQGNLAAKKEISDLELNAGIDPEMFDVSIPEDYDVETSSDGHVLNISEDMSIDEAAKLSGYELFILPENDELYLKQVRTMEIEGFPVINLYYHKPDHPIPYLIITQTSAEPKDIASGYSQDEVIINGEKGGYIELNSPPIKGMVHICREGINITIGCLGDKNETIKWAGRLIRRQNY